MKRMQLVFSALFSACLIGTGAVAQPWPAKTIRMVVANSAGSATDVAGRVFGDLLSKLISRPVAIENRPGGDGFIGAQAVISAAPDGYTLFFASQSTVAIDPNLHKTMPFDPVKDFTAISVICDDTGPTAIFAHPSMPFETLQGLVDYAKKILQNSTTAAPCRYSPCSRIGSRRAPTSR